MTTVPESLLKRFIFTIPFLIALTYLSKPTYPILSNVPSISKNWLRAVSIYPEKHYNFSIALLSFVTGGYARSPRPTSDMKERCDLPFNCFVYDHKDTSFPQASINKFSAIIAWQDGHTRILPYYKLVGGLAARPREQYWISTATESSTHFGNGMHMRGVAHLFNWTATSGYNVTFPFDHFLIAKRKEKKSYEEVENEVKKHFANKAKLACWAVRNCGGGIYTDRNTPAIDLAKHMPEKLHLYGSTRYRCMKGLDEYMEYHGGIPGGYTKAVQRRIYSCMFYLSFENCNCTDYITEKFSNALISYSIPIVNGFKENYQKRLPGSYIHLSDFQDGKKLSEYLQYLRLNWTAYMEYHKWRQFYTVHDLEEAQEQLYCDICNRLKQEKENGNNKTYTIPNAPAFYLQMQTCV